MPVADDDLERDRRDAEVGLPRALDSGAEVNEAGVLDEVISGLGSSLEGLHNGVDEPDDLAQERLLVAVGVVDVDDGGDGFLSTADVYTAEGACGKLFAVEVDGDDGHRAGAP
ncbi:MAG: hypothetical protein D6687_09340 [Acidobacteria bacterium]|nr:MAG: hypothetical protein D6687_09340 [Acidobacteriota bacterium]